MEERFFVASGIDTASLEAAKYDAYFNKTDIFDELIAQNYVSSADLFQHVAHFLDLEFLDKIDPENIIPNEHLDVLLQQRAPMRISHGHQIFIVVTPDFKEIFKLKTLLEKSPELKRQFKVSSPHILRQSVWRHQSEERAKATVRRLQDHRGDLSAKRLLTNKQAFIIGGVVSIFIMLFISAPWTMLTIFYISASLLYLCLNLLRLSAYLLPTINVHKLSDQTIETDLPVYTVLIAIYDEANIAKQLVKAMSRLRWPKSKLDIKFVCEADDHKTIAAIKSANPPAFCEIVEVPDCGPRTKPKALEYAMNGAKGEFIAVYDAEDVPSPDQLLEAYDLFQQAGDRLACVQAPLVIANGRHHWLSALFSLEYAGQFRRLVPLLAHFNLPIPLGGTSNHFRKKALLAVGGWDPCNVTEDADLGIRFHRMGYHIGVMKRPTLEYAPVNISIWVKQRTRWYKGWMQTWLVFMRQPIKLIKSNGWVSFIAMQVVIAGMLATVLSHPFMYVFLAYLVLHLIFGQTDYFHNLAIFMLVLNSINIFGGYILFVVLGWFSFIPRERQAFKLSRLFYIPSYWLLMSVAAWRAVKQLPFSASQWEKTPHQPMAPQSKSIK